MRIYRKHDEQVCCDIIAKDGSLGDLEFIGRLYADVRDDGSTTPVFAPGQIDKMAGVIGMPIYIEHAYPAGVKLPRRGQLNKRLYSDPGPESVPVGRVTHVYPNAAPGELWVRAKLDPSGLSDDEVGVLRRSLRDSWVDLSIGYGVSEDPQLLVDTDRRKYYGTVLERVDGTFGRFVESSLTHRGDISPSQVVMVQASRDDDGGVSAEQAICGDTQADPTTNAASAACEANDLHTDIAMADGVTVGDVSGASSAAVDAAPAAEPMAVDSSAATEAPQTEMEEAPPQAAAAAAAAAQSAVDTGIANAPPSTPATVMAPPAGGAAAAAASAPPQPSDGNQQNNNAAVAAAQAAQLAQMQQRLSQLQQKQQQLSTFHEQQQQQQRAAVVARQPVPNAATPAPAPAPAAVAPPPPAAQPPAVAPAQDAVSQLVQLLMQQVLTQQQQHVGTPAPTAAPVAPAPAAQPADKDAPATFAAFKELQNQYAAELATLKGQIAEMQSMQPHQANAQVVADHLGIPRDVALKMLAGTDERHAATIVQRATAAQAAARAAGAGQQAGNGTTAGASRQQPAAGGGGGTKAQPSASALTRQNLDRLAKAETAVGMASGGAQTPPTKVARTSDGARRTDELPGARAAMAGSQQQQQLPKEFTIYPGLSSNADVANLQKRLEASKGENPESSLANDAFRSALGLLGLSIAGQ